LIGRYTHGDGFELNEFEDRLYIASFGRSRVGCAFRRASAVT
jgi:hypothetical protein